MAGKPILHSRDHEHGGTDPVRIQWESTGGEGSGHVVLPTIKAIFSTTSPPNRVVVGQTAHGDDGDWTYTCVLPDPELLYIDSDGYIARDFFDSEESQGALYLVNASARFSGLSGDGNPIASLQTSSDTFTATDTEAFDKRVSIGGETWLQRCFVLPGGPPSTLELRHDADSATNCQAVLTVTLTNPGPVALP